MGAPTNQSDKQRTMDASAARDAARGSWRSRASSLRVKVLQAFVVVALVPLVILALFNFVATKQALTNSANQALFAAASQTAAQLDAVIAAGFAVIGAESKLPGLTSCLRSLPGRCEQAPVLDILHSLSQKNPVFISSYALLDLQGRNLVDTDGSGVGSDESAHDYFQAALETGVPYVSSVEFSAGDGKAYVYFSSAIADAVTGKPLGVLRARYGAAFLQQLVVQDNGLIGAWSYPVLLDESGLILADGFSSPGSPLGILYKSASSVGLADSLVLADSPAPYFFVQRSGSNEMAAAAVKRMKMRPWVVAFLEPQEMLLAPAREQALNTAVLAAVIVFIVAIVAVGTARLLTTPIMHLTDMARHVTKGNLDAKADIETNDEIGVLAGAFNSMTEQLRASILSLEQRVAELDRASLALRESEGRYRLVFENSPVSIWEEDFSGVKRVLDDLKMSGVVDLENHLAQHPETLRQCADMAKIVAVNQAAVMLHDAKNEQELLSGLANTFTPESFSTFRQELICLWHGGTEMTRDAVVKTLAGERRDVIVYFSVCPGYEETLSKIIVSLTDITERKRTEDALRLSSERLQLATHVARIGIWDWDVSSNDLVWDDSMYQLYGINRGDFSGAYDAWLCTIHPDDKAHTDEEIQSALRGEHEYAPEFRIVRPDGSIRHIKADSRTTRDQDGKPLRMIGTNIDITEHKQAQGEIHQLNQKLEQRVAERTAELLTANKELESFAYTISHDLRAPLRHIDGFLGLLKTRTIANLDDKSQYYMETIADAARRMGAMVDELLAFLRLGRREMRMERVDLGVLLSDVISEFEAVTTQRRIDWRIGELPLVTGDRAMLRMVLVNLISNALKFTQKRAKAEIEIGNLPDQEAQTCVFVRDNGVGFDMQYVQKLFGVFQRLHGSDEFEGIGIGLANVRRIIGRHGGKAWAEGKIDIGATFYFSLPLLLVRPT